MRFEAPQGTTCFIGNYLDANLVEKKGSVVVDNDRITAITENGKEITSCDHTIRLDDDQLLMPGLIDLHTHSGWNFLPAWVEHDRGTDTVWMNRFQWRNNKKYLEEVEDRRSELSKIFKKKVGSSLGGRVSPKEGTKHTFGQIMQIWAEIQALHGGTTTLQENTAFDGMMDYYDDSHPKSKEHLLLRNTGNAEDMGGKDPKDLILSVVDFYQASTKADDFEAPKGEPVSDTAHWMPFEWWYDRNDREPRKKKGYNLKKYIQSLKDTTASAKGLLLHLAEGKASGVLGNESCQYTAKEFPALVKRLRESEVSPFLKEQRVGVIHGCGIDFKGEDWKWLLGNSNVSLIWSPVSNILLYGDTMRIDHVLSDPAFSSRSGHSVNNVCLGSDWSPSGSKNVLEEARNAKFLIEKKSMNVSDEQLFEMIAKSPAKCLGLNAGTLSIGNMADLVITKVIGQKNHSSKSFLQRLFHQTPDLVIPVATIVGGTLVYGTSAVVSQVSGNYMKVPRKLHDGDHRILVPQGFTEETIENDFTIAIEKLGELEPSLGYSKPDKHTDKHYWAMIEDCYKKRIDPSY